MTITAKLVMCDYLLIRQGSIAYPSLTVKFVWPFRKRGFAGFLMRDRNKSPHFVGLHKGRREFDELGAFPQHNALDHLWVCPN
jgi:hypothetical protein